MRDIIAAEVGTQQVLALQGSAPQPSPLPVVDEPCRLWHGEKLVGVYTGLQGGALSDAEAVAAQSRYSETRRTNGLSQTSVVYGSLPRVSVRNDYCRRTAPSMGNPALYAKACSVAQAIAAAYHEHLPHEYAHHLQHSTSTILPEWMVEGTPFTSINFNKNFAIPYHRDKANDAGMFSNVLIVRRGILGGQLVLPDFGVALAMRHGSLVLFAGDKLMHGVLPFRPYVAGGYRCSVVAYTLGTMKNCLCGEEELRRAQGRRTEVESSLRSEAMVSLAKAKGVPNA